MFNKTVLNLGESTEEAEKLIKKIMWQEKQLLMKEIEQIVQEKVDKEFPRGNYRDLSFSVDNYKERILKLEDKIRNVFEELRQDILNLHAENRKISERLNFLFNICQVRYDSNAIDIKLAEGNKNG